LTRPLPSSSPRSRMRLNSEAERRGEMMGDMSEKKVRVRGRGGTCSGAPAEGF
jgi:hypothetical protein